MDADRPRQPAEVVVARVRELRANRLSGAAIAKQMTEKGFSWDRNTIVKLENGHRKSVSLEEWLALADILEVSPLALILPQNDDDYQVFPNTVTTASAVYEWIVGQRNSPSGDGEPVDDERAKARARLHGYVSYVPLPTADPIVVAEVRKVNDEVERHSQQISQIVLTAMDELRLRDSVSHGKEVNNDAEVHDPDSDQPDDGS